MATVKERKIRDSKSGKIKTSYHVRIRLKGQPLQCATFTKKTLADKWIQDTESAIRDGRHFRTAESKKHTFSDMIDRYIQDVLPRKPKSYRKQKAQLLWWKGQLGHKILSEVLPPLLVEQRDKLAREKLSTGEMRSPSTVIRYMAALSHVFSVAMKEWGWLEDSPMRKVSKPKEPRGRVRFLTDDERSRLLQACKNSVNPHLYLITVLALSTGMRYSEIMWLTWKDVDFERQRIILHETKNNERRPVPLVGYGFDLLLAHSKNRRLDTFLLFPSSRDPKKPASIRQAWLKALEESELVDFRFHDLRHSYASELAMGKATLTELRALLGHKSHSQTARYAHLTERHGTSLVDAMTRRIFEREKESNGQSTNS